MASEQKDNNKKFSTYRYYLQDWEIKIILENVEKVATHWTM